MSAVAPGMVPCCQELTSMASSGQMQIGPLVGRPQGKTSWENLKIAWPWTPSFKKKLTQVAFLHSQNNGWGHHVPEGLSLRIPKLPEQYLFMTTEHSQSALLQVQVRTGYISFPSSLFSNEQQCRAPCPPYLIFRVNLSNISFSSCQHQSCEQGNNFTALLYMALSERSNICAASTCMYYLCSGADMPGVLQT